LPKLQGRAEAKEQRRARSTLEMGLRLESELTWNFPPQKSDGLEECERNPETLSTVCEMHSLECWH
jgi:hypothetical protein